MQSLEQFVVCRWAFEFLGQQEYDLIVQFCNKMIFLYSIARFLCKAISRVFFPQVGIVTACCRQCLSKGPGPLSLSQNHLHYEKYSNLSGGSLYLHKTVFGFSGISLTMLTSIRNHLQCIGTRFL